MNSISVKKGDNVLIIAGKDKGKVAKVVASQPKLNKVVVEGVNVVTKCKKARNAQEKSTMIKIEAPIDASNVMVVCPSCGKATRVGHAVIDGKKVRVCKHSDCASSLDVAKSKKADKKTTTKKSSTKKEEKQVEVKETKKTATKKADTKEVEVKEEKPKKTTTKKTTTKKASAKTAESK